MEKLKKKKDKLNIWKYGYDPEEVAEKVNELVDYINDKKKNP